jgi:hypothetical protein
MKDLLSPFGLPLFGDLSVLDKRISNKILPLNRKVIGGSPT